jgi:hypothetical protein
MQSQAKWPVLMRVRCGSSNMKLWSVFRESVWQLWALAQCLRYRNLLPTRDWEIHQTLRSSFSTMAQIAKDEVERPCAAGTEQMQGGHLWTSSGGEGARCMVKYDHNSGF